MPNPRSIGNYGDLDQAVRTYSEQEDLSSDDIALFVSLAESDFNQELKLEILKATQTGQTDTGNVIALPDDFLELLNLRISVQNHWVIPDYLDPKTFYDGSDTGNVTGIPYLYTRVGNEIRLRNKPDAEYNYELDYYASLTPLDPDNAASTNVLLDYEPSVYLYNTLARCAEFYDDDRHFAKWSSLYEKTRQNLHQLDGRSRHRPGVKQRQTKFQSDGAYRVA